MSVEKRPDKLPADVFETEFEVRVVIDGVVAAVKGGRGDVEALLIGDFVRMNEAGRIAGARSGDGRIEGMGKRVAKSYMRRGGLDRVGDRDAIEHARLSSPSGREC